MIYLLYLAKPKYGGWVTFSAQLAMINNTHIHKITKCGEKKHRDYGYGVQYRNIPLSILDNLKKDDKIIISAIDKHFHFVLKTLDLSKCTIVIHDPTEIKSQKEFLLDYLPHMNVITIRKSVHDLLNSINIKNTFKPHPYIKRDTISLQSKNGVVSISRVDWDKHTDIIVKANKLLRDKISIYGDKNDRYVYQKLRDLDTMKEEDPSSCYRGRFNKDPIALRNILKSKQFVIDLSKIKLDGGGTQYTFLEAIDNNCILILNKDWVNVKNSIWETNINCLSVSNENELVDILQSTQKIPISDIMKQSKKILSNHSCKKTIQKWVF